MYTLTDPDYILYLENLKNRILSDFYLKSTLDKSIRMDKQESILRFEINELGFYFLVTENLVTKVTELLEGKKCLEVMSGNGFFAQCLSDKGLSIIATDSKEWDIKDNGNVIQLSALEAIKKYKDEMDILIICWPYMDNNAYQAIKAWGTEKPILVLGEIGGCCADDIFSNSFKSQIVDVGHQRFFGIHDYFYLGNYTEVNEEDFY